MARPERRNVDYFPHIVKKGSKMEYLEQRYGNDGYAVWYKIMEKLATANDHHIDLSCDLQVSFLSAHCKVSEGILLEIIEFLVRAKWLHFELWNQAKIVCSPDFIDSIQDAYKKRVSVCVKVEEIGFRYGILPPETKFLPPRKPQRREEYSKEDYIVEEWDKKFVQFAKEMMSDITWQEVIRRQRDKLRKKDNMRAAIEHFISHCHLNKHTHEKIDDFKNHFQNFILTDAYFKIEFN